MAILLAHYDLTEDDCSAEISTKCLEKISHSLCGEWRNLPSGLDMEDIVKQDIDRNPRFSEEKQKRQAFFEEWNKQKGSAATYRKLISALLDIDCRKDAEGVCEILKNSIATRTKSPIRNGTTSVVKA